MIKNDATGKQYMETRLVPDDTFPELSVTTSKLGITAKAETNIFFCNNVVIVQGQGNDNVK